MNVHPTKREVHFLDEELIIERVADTIQTELAGQSRSRVFEYQVRTSKLFLCFRPFIIKKYTVWNQTQTLLTGGTLEPISAANKGKEKVSQQEAESEGEEEASSNLSSAKRGGLEPKKTYSKDKVRMSQSDRTLDSMFPILHQPTQSSSPDKEDSKYRKGKEKEVEIPPPATQTPTWIKTQEIEESECYLTSVNNLREKIQKAKHSR